MPLTEEKKKSIIAGIHTALSTLSTASAFIPVPGVAAGVKIAELAAGPAVGLALDVYDIVKAQLDGHEVTVEELRELLALPAQTKKADDYLNDAKAAQARADGDVATP